MTLEHDAALAAVQQRLDEQQEQLETLVRAIEVMSLPQPIGLRRPLEVALAAIRERAEQLLRGDRFTPAYERRQKPGRRLTDLT